ncbi:hypothetical protein SDRG_14214 [Saprolegnia diclina VS20]|uniref:Uncharacterized protein n=1 Tax=Saprolegnia diclina (strain VS20) TaxID=1156394 RepID=T0Q3F9_SAPDV|nr:hypothetical protein SDRG_14214 [Saprolegnia diclina VS20]EQC27935.1 hypothetical protein SDRG_14214 [Saprolegnia diclina VS20]|eukprot:XP_008618548.1 hypothetical protein SDRG_14214 [Saprolegnia diclina VS20]
MVLLRFYLALATWATAAVLGQHPEFHAACANNKVEVVAGLLKTNPEVLNEVGPEGGQTCLMRACLFGSIDVVKLLLTYPGIDVMKGEKDGYTPMHGAAYQGRPAVAKLLLEHGLSPTELHKDGFAPFHRAAWGSQRRHTETVRVFLEAGVPRDLKNADGLTAVEITENYYTRRLLQNLQPIDEL